jgi:hypothetical protein
MTQPLTTSGGSAGFRASCPNTPECPDTGRRASLAGLVLFAACCVVAGAAEPRPGWGRTLVVTRPQQEHAPLQAAYNHAVGRGVSARYAVAVLSELDGYIERRVMKAQIVSLSQGLIVDTISAAHRAQWPAGEASRLLLALQAEMDGTSRPMIHFQQSLERVRPGGTVEEVIGVPAPGRAAR